MFILVIVTPFEKLSIFFRTRTIPVYRIHSYLYRLPQWYRYRYRYGRYGSTVPVRTSTLAPQRSQPQQDFVPVVYHHPGMYLRYPYTVVVPTLTDTVKSLTTNLHPHRRGQAADAEPECPSTAASWPASTCRLQEEYDVRCRWHLLKY